MIEKINPRIAFLAATLLSLTNVQATPLISDGSDGLLAPNASVVVDPGADGIFNFTSIQVPEDVVVSFDYSELDGDLFLLATGDVVIDGALDLGEGPAHIYALGNITFQGKLYGDAFDVRAGNGLYLLDNPNGSPDAYFEGQAARTIVPDGMLPIDSELVDQTVASELSGVMTTLATFDAFFAVMSMQIFDVSSVAFVETVQHQVVSPSAVSVPSSSLLLVAAVGALVVIRLGARPT